MEDKKKSSSKKKSKQIIHTIVVSGELDMLLKVHQVFREPEVLSDKFLYKWVATEGMNKQTLKTTKNKSLANLCAYKIATEWDAFSENQKKSMALKIPIDLWKRIFYFIPLTTDRVFQIGRCLQKAGLCSLQESSQWKLNERGVLLYEFVAHSELTTKQIIRWSTFFPDLKFYLRISSEDKTSLSIFLSGESIFTLERKKNLSPEISDNLFDEAGEYAKLFRQTSKMAMYDSSPKQFIWAPLYNHNALDMLYVWQTEENFNSQSQPQHNATL